jgi:hypothetical protein
MKQDTRDTILEGLRQALQARVAAVWSNVTLAGEQAQAAKRFKEGITSAVSFYEHAVKAVEDMED